jgi:hypothetical protein
MIISEIMLKLLLIGMLTMASSIQLPGASLSNCIEIEQSPGNPSAVVQQPLNGGF